MSVSVCETCGADLLQNGKCEKCVAIPKPRVPYSDKEVNVQRMFEYKDKVYIFRVGWKIEENGNDEPKLTCYYDPSIERRY